MDGLWTWDITRPTTALVKTITVKTPDNTPLKTNMSPKRDDFNRTYMDFQGKFVRFWGCTWRIIPASKWLVNPICKPFRPFGRWTTLLRGLTNHGYKPLTKWDDPPSRPSQKESLVFQLPSINFQVLLLLVSGTVTPMGHVHVARQKFSKCVDRWKCRLEIYDRQNILIEGGFFCDPTEVWVGEFSWKWWISLPFVKSPFPPKRSYAAS